MSEFRTQRLRDPVHGLIVFNDNPMDRLAWQLLDAPEFQRLRRIKQLGVSEFVFPGAVHTRFAHCIGVFHTARKLANIIEREIHAIKEEFKPNRAEVAVIAALLHDLGHGPFSHTFEGVQKSLGVKKRHEQWTADIIRNPSGGIRPVLESHCEGLSDTIADLLESEDPQDIYHAIVSSSFDADRLDYLQRDRLITGTRAGAIDIDWLLEHVKVRVVSLEAPEAGIGDEGQTGPRAPTFCLSLKALPAAEQFLLARYTLHEQVYFHKTTRCIEHMIGKLLRAVADCAGKPSTAPKGTGLDKGHPLLRFFAKDGATTANYLALDDGVIVGSLERMTRAEDRTIADLAHRLRERRLYKTLDMQEFGVDGGRRLSVARKLERLFANQMGDTVLKDEGAALSIYTQVGGDDEKAHKKLRILDGSGKPHEITALSPIILALRDKRTLTRYYFANESDRQRARQREGATQ